MRRLRFPIPISILLFLALTFAGAYYVRKGMLERAMIGAMETRDLARMKSLTEWWPAPVNAVAYVGPEKNWNSAEHVLPSDMTPLDLAALKGDLDLARVLIARGARLDAPPGEAGHPLHYAVMAGEAEMVRLLIEKGREARTLRREERDLLGLVTAPWNTYPLFIYEPSNTPPWHDPDAARKTVATAQVLLDAGADVNSKDECGTTPLHAAAHTGDVGLVKLLIAHGAKLDATSTTGETPLHWAMAHPEVAETLIRAGANVRIPDSDNSSVLDYVAGEGNIRLLRVMVECGLDVKARAEYGKYGATLLHVAVQPPMMTHSAAGRVEKEDVDFARLLVEKGADVNARDLFGSTPLHMACTAEVVRLLVAAGADVNAKADDGRTPLHCMVGNNFFGGWYDDAHEATAAPHEEPPTAPSRLVEAVEALLAAGADVNAKDNQGKTPLRLLRSREGDDADVSAAMKRIEDILLKAGAKE